MSAPSRHGVSGRPATLAGTATVIRHILRRDRVRIPVWVTAIVVFTLPSAAALPDLYATRADRQARAVLMENPGAKIFTGPGYGLDDYTFGAMTANEFLPFMTLIVALMSVLLVVRHTRAEEETGRAELVRATVVGRHAMTTATLIVVGGLNVVIGGLLALGLPATLDELSVVGSLALGASVAAAGLVFTAVAAVAAQVTEHARGAVGLGVAAIGVGWALFVVGNVAVEALSWATPFGWSAHSRAYVDERWWPLALFAGLFAALAAAAFAASTRRDLGAGLRRPRAGRAAASPALAGPFGLALRLQRGSVIAWAVGVCGFALLYGTVVTAVEDFIAENEAIQQFVAAAGGADLVDSFFSTIVLMLAMLVAGFAISSALRMRGEETTGRAEPVLAAAVPRWRWAAGHLTIAALGGGAILVLAGAALGLSAAATTGDTSWIPEMTLAASVHVPGLWLVVGLAVALFGLLPRAAALVWAVLAYAVAVGVFGSLLGLPDWTYDLSPLGHTPKLPAEELTVTPLVILAAIAAGLLAAGLAGFRRRDLSG